MTRFFALCHCCQRTGDFSEVPENRPLCLETGTGRGLHRGQQLPEMRIAMYASLGGGETTRHQSVENPQHRRTFPDDLLRDRTIRFPEPDAAMPVPRCLCGARAG